MVSSLTATTTNARTSLVNGSTALKTHTAPTTSFQAQEATLSTDPVKVAQTAPSAPVDSNEAKLFIYNKESGNNPNSINRSSGACGLGQALPCSKMGCALGDYACQDNWFTNNYMKPRYGTWDNAKAFWLSKHWW